MMEIDAATLRGECGASPVRLGDNVTEVAFGTWPLQVRASRLTNGMFSIVDHYGRTWAPDGNGWVYSPVLYVTGFPLAEACRLASELAGDLIKNRVAEGTADGE